MSAVEMHNKTSDVKQKLYCLRASSIFIDQLFSIVIISPVSNAHK